MQRQWKTIDRSDFIQIVLICMAILILILCTQYDVFAYNLTCPTQSQRRFRNAFCIDLAKPHYTCLLNVLDGKYYESCEGGTSPFEAKKGERKIRRPGITNGHCTEKRYQPIPFTTDEFSECMYRKSFCSEEGQVIANNGSSGDRDRSCRCDYRAGYTYIVEPRNRCECVPSEEDCSCYRKWCPPGEEVSRDYECRVKNGVYLTTCDAITGAVRIDPGHTQVVSAESMDIADSNSMSHTSGGKAAAGLVITLVLLALLLGVLLVDFRPHVTEMTVYIDKNHVIYRDDNNHVYYVIEGVTMSVDCKVRSKIRVKSIKMVKVSPQRETSKIVVNSVRHNKKQLESGICRGESKQLCPTDTGEHRCILTSPLPQPLNIAKTLNSKSARNQILKYLTDFPPFSAETTNRITLNVHEFPSATDIEIKKGYSGKIIKLTAALESKSNILSVQWTRVSPDLKLKRLPHIGSTTYSIENTTMGDSGDYICFMTTKNATDDQTVHSHGFRLNVIPSESSYDKAILHREDDTYVQILTVDRAMEKLRKHKMVVLTGREGTGKTKMCLEIASRCEDQHKYSPVMVTSKKDFKEEFDNEKVLYILDQSDDMDVAKFKELCTFLLDRTLPPQAWTILACRSLYGAEVGDERLLDCDNVLSNTEKDKILVRYMTKHNVGIAATADCNYRQKEIIKNNDIGVTLDKDAVDEIITTEPLQGFPLMAKKFCDDRQKLHLGEKFFTSPPKEVVDRIIELRETAIRNCDCEAFLMFCLLVYLTTKKSYLNVKDIKKCHRDFNQVYTLLAKNKFQRFKGYLNAKFDDSDEKKIRNAVNKMIGTYLKETDGICEFIQPHMSKATFLSSQYFATNGLANCPLEYILEFIRSCKYNKDKEEMVLKIDREYTNIHVLCERLVREIAIRSDKENEEDKAKDKVNEEDKTKEKLTDADIAKEKLRKEGLKDIKVKLYEEDIENKRGKLSEEDIENNKGTLSEVRNKLRKKQTKVCTYIYDEWVKLGDEEFCRNLFKHIDCVFCNRNEESYNIQAWHMLRLMNHMTCNGKDPWIYSIQDLPDMAVIFGLISASKNSYSLNEQKKATFEMLLDVLGSRLVDSKEGLKKKSQSHSSVKLTKNDKSALQIDQYGNTLFHYICLYNENEACQIMEKYIQLMNKKCLKECLHMKSKESIQPIHLAVALGKSKFLEKIKSVIDILMKDDKEGNILLKQILQYVKDVHIKRKDSKDLSAFDLNKNFDPEISRSVTQGSKEDFEQVLKLFPGKWLNENLSKSIKK